MTVKRVLGFDCSSSTTGYCLLELNDDTNKIKLIEVSYLKPMKTEKGSIIERLADTRNKLADIINQLRPTDIAIEEIITFMPRRSSANTVITLAVFNRMLGLLSFDYLNKAPTMYPVMQMRRGISNSNPPPQKEEIPE